MTIQPSLSRNTSLFLFAIFSNIVFATSDNDELEVIQIKGHPFAHRDIVEKTEMLLSVPGINHDPINAIYNLPGVVYAGGDIGGEPSVRGSSPNDNAYFLDDVPVSYIFHILGNSIINPSLLADFSLYPSAHDMQYFNATGAIFDAQMRDPRPVPITKTLEFSFINTGLLIEGSLADDHAFYIAFRESLIHLFIDEEEEDEGIRIFDPPRSRDYQIKHQWRPSRKLDFTFSAIGATDLGGLSVSQNSEVGLLDPALVGDATSEMSFGAQSTAVRALLTPGLQVDTLLYHQHSSSEDNFGAEQFYKTDSTEYGARLSLLFDMNSYFSWRIGIDVIQKDTKIEYDFIPYICTEHEADCFANRAERVADSTQIEGDYLGAYIKSNIRITPSLTATIAIRAEDYKYSGQEFLLPRLELKWYLNDSTAITAKSAMYARFPDEENIARRIGNPSLLVPEATHYALSLETLVLENWSFSSEVYFRQLKNLARAEDALTPTNQVNYSNDLSGETHGIDLMLERKRTSNWSGWLAISYAKAERTDELTGMTQPYFLETPIIANIVGNYYFENGWKLGIRFTARSGARYSPISGLRQNPNFPDLFLPEFGELNSAQLPTYHRLDLEATYENVYWGYPITWSASILNLLNAKNISDYYYAPTPDDTLEEFNIKGEEGLGAFASLGIKAVF